MEYKTLTDNIKLPILGLGTWEMGGDYRRDTKHDAEDIAAIKRAIAAGISHIDTAELYGDGHAEELVAQTIKSFDRKKLFITSKVKPEHCCTHDDVIAACKRSLQRLQTTYLDLYLIHWREARGAKTNLKETFRALDHLIDKKLVRFIGVSNFDVKDLQEAQHYAKHNIVANQINYSLLARNGGKFTKNMEKEIIPYCKNHNIKIVAFRPLEKGKLCTAGKYPVLDALAQKYKKTQGQIALNWLFCKEVFVLVKTSDEKHLQENLGSLGWRLAPKDVAALDEAFKKY
jgi:diketogulonate reductase-like aldo/keto reductase